MLRVTLVCTLGLLALVMPTVAVKVTPIQKVLQLMDDMLVKAQREKKDEAVRFSAFNQWCGDQTRIKNNAIEKANAEIEELKAQIQKAESDIEQLAAQIAELEEDIGRWTKDIQAATEVREKEKVDFQATHKDYSESLDALERAINVLRQQNYDRPQAAALVQASLMQLRRSPRVPE